MFKLNKTSLIISVTLTVASAMQERARLDEQRAKDMQALRASQSFKDSPHPPRQGSATKAIPLLTPAPRMSSALPPLVEPTQSLKQLSPEAAAEEQAATGDGLEAGGHDVALFPGGMAESCADGGDVGDEAHDGAAAPKERTGRGKRPRDEAEGSMAFQYAPTLAAADQCLCFKI